MKKIILALLMAVDLGIAYADPIAEATAANARGDYAAEQKITRPFAT